MVALASAAAVAVEPAAIAVAEAAVAAKRQQHQLQWCIDSFVIGSAMTLTSKCVRILAKMNAIKIEKKDRYHLRTDLTYRVATMTTTIISKRFLH